MEDLHHINTLLEFELEQQEKESAQQEKTGYWFFSTTDFKTHCSVCGQSEWHGYIPTPEEALKWMPICPKCGARMKESEIRVKKVRPAASVELDYGNDGRDCRYYVAYKCPTCGKSTIKGTVACDRCGTFFRLEQESEHKGDQKGRVGVTMKAVYAFFGFIVSVLICALFNAPPEYKLIATAIIVAGAMAGRFD